jgi:hypothetical protein
VYVVCVYVCVTARNGLGVPSLVTRCVCWGHCTWSLHLWNPSPAAGEEYLLCLLYLMYLLYLLTQSRQGLPGPAEAVCAVYVAGHRHTTGRALGGSEGVHQAAYDLVPGWHKLAHRRAPGSSLV